MQFAKKLGLLVLYLWFLTCSGIYVFNLSKYKNKEAWPELDATIVGHGAEKVHSLTEMVGGRRALLVDTRFVNVRYSVDGQDYLTTIRPIGAEFPFDPEDFPSTLDPRFFEGLPSVVFYDPLAPQVAALSSKPYEDTRLLTKIGVLGSLVIIHIITVMRKRVRNS